MSSSVQTDIDRYTPLNKNNKEKFEFKQNYLLCYYCHKVKFIRTSHCRVCDKCISFRDHHCPFVTNCIGFNNMQYFLNFCIWGMYGIIFVMYSYFKFKYINLSLFMRIFINIDFIGNILFLLTPSESFAKIENLVNKLCDFEHLLDKNVLLEKMLPDLVKKIEKYK